MIGTNGTPEDWDRQDQTTNKPVPAFEAVLQSKKELPLSNTSGYHAEKERIAIQANIQALKDKMEKGLTSDDLELVAGAIAATKQANPKVQETKKLIETFKEKTSKYPQYLSYDGSIVLCVLLSMNDYPSANLVSLPTVDQTLIKSLVPSQYELNYFWVKFDGEHDFELDFRSPSGKDIFKLVLFNTVAHPRATDLDNAGEVKIEKDGDKIAIGGKIKLNPRTARVIMGMPCPSAENEPSHKSDDKYTPPRPVAGRNAYEIRADVLQMALEWGKAKDFSRPQDIIELAKEFYAFVENKRSR